MGGFSPPVPTAPTVNSGVRTVTHTSTADSLIRDVSLDVQFEHADAAPLLAFTKAVRGKKAATQRKFEWKFIPDYPRDCTSSAAQTAAETSFTIPEYANLVAGMQLMNIRTSEVLLVAATPTTSTVTVARLGNAAAVLAGDNFRIISNAQEEVHSAPAIRSQAEAEYWNVTQWFERTWGMSKRDANTASYIGRDPVIERKKAIKEFNQDIEEAFINGYRYINSTAGAVNSSELTATGGARFWIQSNYWNLGQTRPTEEQLFEWLGYIFEFGEGGYSRGGTGKKVAFCSPAWLALLETFAKGKMEMVQASDKIGMKVAMMQSTVGDLVVKLHPLFAKPGYRDKMLVLDLNHVAYRYHQGLDTTIEENIQTPGDSVIKHHIYADCGLEFNGDERAHGWAEGLEVAVA